MVKTIYADVLFLINFIINYLILFTVGRIGAARLWRLRLFAGAALGALYGVLVFFPATSFFSSFPVKIAVSFLMVFCAFGKHAILKMTLLFLAVSIAFGGVVFLASFLGLGDFCEVRGGIYYIHISLPALLVSALLAYFLLSAVFLRCGKTRERKFGNITVYANGAEISFLALHDTGNSLCDPLTNAPVVISDYPTLRDILPADARDVLDSSSPQSFPLALPELEALSGFQLIPYKTLSTDFSLMLAYRPEKVMLDGEVIRGALVAISPHGISDGGAYAALV